jgi:hypothetical protein
MANAPVLKTVFRKESEIDTRVRTVSKGVNLKTVEGARLSFDSLEDMESYMDALIAEDYDNEI